MNMDALPWLLTFLALGLWLAVGGDLIRRPPELPRGGTRALRRGLWTALALAGLVAGGWGPELWSRTSVDMPRDPSPGPAVGMVETTLRTPFAVQTSRHGIDAEARRLRSERTLALQLPVVLLIFFGGVFWVRYREGRSSEPDHGAAQARG
jgi:hypothetical protein